MKFWNVQEIFIAKQASGITLWSRVLAYPMIFVALTGCSIEASIIDDLVSMNPESSKVLNRTSPDFISGEIVTTSSGYQVKAVFGEISEKTDSLNGNGWQIEGVFYE